MRVRCRETTSAGGRSVFLVIGRSIKTSPGLMFRSLMHLACIHQYPLNVVGTHVVCVDESLLCKEGDPPTAVHLVVRQYLVVLNCNNDIKRCIVWVNTNHPGFEVAQQNKLGAQCNRTFLRHSIQTDYFYLKTTNDRRCQMLTFTRTFPSWRRTHRTSLPLSLVLNRLPFA